MKISRGELSASKIKTYLECPFKYLMEYILGQRKGQTFATTNGTIIHETLEMYSFGHKKHWEKELFLRYKKLKPWQYQPEFKTHKADCPGCLLLEHIDNFEGNLYDALDEQTVQKACPLHSCLLEGRRLVQGVIDRQDKPLEKKIIDAEKEFHLELDDGVLITGIIDLVCEIDSNTIEIRDWKTGNWLPTYEDAIADPQLKMYDLAVSMLYPQYEHRLLTFDYIKHKAYTFCISDEQRADNRAWIVEIAKKIEADMNPRRNLTYKCKFFCQPDLCNVLWPQKLKMIEELKKTKSI